MANNRIHPIDEVMIEIFFEGKKVDTYQGSGFHTVEEAVDNAYEGSNRTPLDKEDYVFEVRNLTTGTEARYRVNAGEHVRIIPEEKVEG